jgi:hypothetical protein
MQQALSPAFSVFQLVQALVCSQRSECFFSPAFSVFRLV